MLAVLSGNRKLGFNSLGIVLDMIFFISEKSPDLSDCNYQRYYRLNGVYNNDTNTPLRVAESSG